MLGHSSEGQRVLEYNDISSMIRPPVRSRRSNMRCPIEYAFPGTIIFMGGGGSPILLIGLSCREDDVVSDKMFLGMCDGELTYIDQWYVTYLIDYSKFEHVTIE